MGRRRERLREGGEGQRKEERGETERKGEREIIPMLERCYAGPEETRNG